MRSDFLERFQEDLPRLVDATVLRNLGFTFICGENRQGKFLLCRKTRRDRLRAKLREIKEELRRRLHRPIPEQGAWLKQVVSGYYAYHAVPTNGRVPGIP